MKRKNIIQEKNIFKTIAEDDCNKKYLKWLNDLNVNQFLETRWKKQNIKSIKKFVSEINKSNYSYIFGIINKETKEHIGNIK